MLFILALLMLVAGVFAFSVDWNQGGGLTLMGIGIAVPTAWWLRHGGGKKRVRYMRIIAFLGLMLAAGGAILLPWNDLVSERVEQRNNTHEKMPGSNTAESLTPSPTRTSTVKSSTQTAEAESPSRKSTPSGMNLESTATVTEVETLVPPRETVTAVETLIPPQITVYSEAPIAPAPMQTTNPDAVGTGAQREPSDDVPSEPSTQTGGTSLTPTESGESRQQEQAPGERGVPSDQDIGGSRNGVGYPG